MGRWLSSIGILCDIVGAIFVSIEVVRQYEGQRFKPLPNKYGYNPIPEPTPEFESYEKLKYFWMKIGLGFLLAGFLLQLIGMWI